MKTQQVIEDALNSAKSIGDASVLLAKKISDLESVIKKQGREIIAMGDTINEQCDTINDLQAKLAELQAAAA